MKKVLVGVSTAIVIVCISAVSVFATCSKKQSQNLVKTKNNGIDGYFSNDYCYTEEIENNYSASIVNIESTKQNKNFVDANGDGICDLPNNCMCINSDSKDYNDCTHAYRGSHRTEYGRNFVDSNRDDICDNAISNTRPQDGTGQKNSCRRGCNW